MGISRIQKKARRPAQKLQPWYGLEPLEGRLFLSAVSWIGPDGGLWSTPANWTGGTGVPTSTDDVTISLGSEPTVNFTSAAGNVTVQSLTCNNPLAISGGSLTITGAGSVKASTTSDTLTVTGGTLTVTGSGTSFAASGATSLSRINLFASAGGQIQFPALTTYATNSNAIRATGVGSRIDLSAMTQMTNTSSSGSLIEAVAGGEVDLGGEVNGNLTITLADAGSVLGVSNVTRITNTNVEVSSNPLIFTGVTSLSNVGLLASAGGQIQFPVLTTYATNSNAIRATGVGSRIDLSAMTQMTNTSSSGSLIEAVAGGEVDLGGEVNGNLTITLADAGSVLGVSNVTRITNTNVEVSSNPLIFTGVTSLSNVGLLASAGGQIQFPVLTTYATNSNAIRATGVGSRIDLSAMTQMTNTSSSGSLIEAVAGGEVDLGGEVNGNLTITLADAGSVLGVSNVTRITNTNVEVSSNPLIFTGVTSLSNVGLLASAGGQIQFPALTTYATNSNAIRATGVGSRIDLSAMTQMTNTSSSGSLIEAVAGGEVDLGGEVNGNLTITLADAGSVLGVSNVTRITNTNVEVSSNPLIFTGVTSLSNVGLLASAGGQIQFPVLTTYATNSNAIRATGVGSRIDLSAMTQMTNTSSSGSLIEAVAGGEVDLGGEVNGNLTITLADAESTLNIDAVTKIVNTIIDLTNSATLSLSSGSPITWLGSFISAATEGKLINLGVFSTDGVTINLNGSSLTNQAGGKVIGKGTITGNLINRGIVSPGGDGAAGMLTVAGNFTQDSGGTLRIDIGGTTIGTQYDQLRVSAQGVAALAGTEDIHGINNFVPAVGVDFVTVAGSGVNGTFAEIKSTNLGGVVLTPQYDSFEHFLTAGNGPTASRVRFTQQPADSVVGSGFGPIRVSVEDQSGNLLTGDSSAVTLMIASGPAGATLGGTLTVSAVNGVATFSSLFVDRAGTYTLTAVDGDLASDGSESFASRVEALSDPVINPDNGHVYYLLTSSNWTDAEAQAVALGGHLTTINDGTENDWIVDTFSEYGGSARALWIGLNDVENEGTFVWADGGTSAHRNWAFFAPDNSGGGEDYVELYGPSRGAFAGQWNDFSDYLIEFGETIHGVVELPPGPASKLIFPASPMDATAGQSITPAITVGVEDLNGATVTTDNSTVALLIASGPPGAKLGGTTTAQVLNGIATFGNLRLIKAGTYTLQATDGLLTPATSTSFNITAGAAKQIAIVQQPTVTAAGQPISPFVVVANVQDAFGNLVTDDISGVTLTITGGITFGPTPVSAVNGEAVFTIPSVTPTGTYTIEASRIGLDADSSTTILAANVGAAKTTVTDPTTGDPLATFTLTGGGSAQVTVASDAGNPFFNVRIPTTGKSSTFTVAPAVKNGEPIELRNITLGDSDEPAAFSGGRSTAGIMSGAASLVRTAAAASGVKLKSFSAKDGVLTGIFEVRGAIQTITLGRIDPGGGLQIDALPNGFPTVPVNLSVPNGIHGSIVSAQPIKSITAVEWTPGPGATVSLTAPSLGALKMSGAGRPFNIPGHFEANVTLTGVATGADTLGKVSIAGAIGPGAWNITGDVASITADSTSDGWSLLLSGGSLYALDVKDALRGVVRAESVGKLTTKGRLTALINLTSQNEKGVSLGTLKAGRIALASLQAVGSLGTVSVIEWLAGNINATSLKSLTTTGDKKNQIPGDFGANMTLSDAGGEQTLGKLTVAGTLINSRIVSAGNVGAITLGAMSGSRLDIGATVGIPALADDAGDFVFKPVKPSLAMLSIKGFAANQPSFVSSVINAWNIGKAMLKLVNTGASGPCGFAADSVGSLTFQAVGLNNSKPVTLTKLDTLPDLLDPKKNKFGVVFPVGQFTLTLL